MNAISLRISVMFFIAFVLSIVPLPEVIIPFRPPWVLMVVLYLQLFLPNYFRVTWVLILGMSLDVLLASPLGEHAFAILFTTCLASNKARRFKFFSIAQQMMLIAVFCLTYQGMISLIDIVLGYSNGIIFSAGTLLGTILFWPWIKLIAENTLLPDTRGR